MALLPWHPKESNFQSGLSLEALPLLWKAERCGLHGQHWIVDALRALAAEDLGFLCFFWFCYWIGLRVLEVVHFGFRFHDETNWKSC